MKKFRGNGPERGFWGYPAALLFRRVSERKSAKRSFGIFFRCPKKPARLESVLRGKNTGKVATFTDKPKWSLWRAGKSGIFGGREGGMGQVLSRNHLNEESPKLFRKRGPV